VTDPRVLAAAFARALRDAGLSVPTDSVATFVTALGCTGLDSRDGTYWTGRTVLVHRAEDIATYDRTFTAFWEGGERSDDAADAPAETASLAMDDGSDDAGADSRDATEDGGATITLRWSSAEVLRNKDFATCTADELRDAARAIAALRVHGSVRRSRRLRPVRGRGTHHDPRATLRASLRTRGEPLRLHRRARIDAPRRLVLLLDVSGSMEPYARAMLRFAQAAVTGRRRVEAFAFSTRLTRLTRDLAGRDADRAIARASRTVPDWSSGTRLGGCLREFNNRWGTRGMARGADVVILSDGWDRGDPAELAHEMGRLGRVAHRTIWVNPLKSTPGFAPLARGMAAALPHVDEFVEGHSLGSLEHLATVLARS
jgi:uncharacterized protein with von Willebrand factor type A (vWA) domain